LDSAYKFGRAILWMKSKTRPGQEVVIGSWKMEGARFASLMLGAYRADELVFIGTAGTRFNRRNLPEITKRLRAVETDKSPFSGPNAPRKRTGYHRTTPKLVAEVAYATWTRDGLLRQASFKGLRMDKPADEVVIEKFVAG
jgi:bifunctional non-homologous end joining protein LigD